VQSKGIQGGGALTGTGDVAGRGKKWQALLHQKKKINIRKKQVSSYKYTGSNEHETN
jgi:hypothetical protein